MSGRLDHERLALDIFRDGSTPYSKAGLEGAIDGFLTHKEIRVIRSYYDKAKPKQREIAAEMGFSVSWISSIKTQALLQLRRPRVRSTFEVDTTRLTRRQAAIIGAYTGIACGSFGDIQEYAEEVLGRSVFTHEFASSETVEELKAAAKADFLAICHEADEA